MKRNKYLYLIVILCVICVGYLITLLVSDSRYNTIINKPETTLLVKKPKLEDDFYNYVNYQYLSKNQLDEDEDKWLFMASDAMDKIDSEIKFIVDEIVSDCSSYEENSINDNICDFYNSYQNMASEEVLFNEMNNYINIIKSSTTIEEFINNSLYINQELGTDILFNMGIDCSPKDLNSLYFTFGVMSYDYRQTNSEFYTLEEYANRVNSLKKYNIKLLKEYGYSENEASKIADSVYKMYLDIARFCLKSNKLEKNGYKLYSYSDLQSNLKNINLNNITSKYSYLYNGTDNILVIDINQLKAIDAYLIEDNLDVLKNSAMLKIISNCSFLVNSNYKEIDNELYKAINGVDRDDDIYDYIYDYFRDTIVLKFEERNISANERTFYENLILEYISIFKTRIMNEEWLSDTTKQKALEKMNKMKYTVGNFSPFVFVENKYDVDSSYNFLKNINNTSKELNKEICLQYKNNNIFYGEDPLEINAFYLPSGNSIHILDGIMYATKLNYGLDTNNLSRSYYELLGSIGGTIGHELSHALDSEGSKYDANGNLFNWWLDEDLKRFNELNNKVIKYYNNYNQYGSTTLGENIADLGGMSLTLQLAEVKGATTDDYKKIFETWALEWCSQSTPSYLYIQIMMDEHSPEKSRVNAVLSSMDKFYEVYNIDKNDNMYVPKEDRVAIW